jgi:serine/threonine protein kinase
MFIYSPYLLFTLHHLPYPDKPLRPLGKGATGQIILLEHIKTKKQFAGKRMMPEGEEVEAAEKEANIGMFIKCLFVVIVVDTFMEDFDRWVLMEYCEGGNMRTWLNEFNKKGKKLSEDVCDYLLCYCLFLFLFFILF